MSRFSHLFASDKPIIGMIHLAALPDFPQSPGIEQVIEQALADLSVLERAGFDGVLVENEYDRPHRIEAAPETRAAITEVTSTLVQQSRNCIVGCEILLNDPRASLGVAKASGAQFIRTDYFVDKMTRPEYGEFAIDPQGLIRYRSSINAGQVLIFADIQVKYATMVEQRPLEDSARIACTHQADAVVVTGSSSGSSPDVEDLCAAARGVNASGRAVPVLVGSGLAPENAAALLANCDGAIVGTALMRERAVDPARTRSLMSAIGRAIS